MVSSCMQAGHSLSDCKYLVLACSLTSHNVRLTTKATAITASCARGDAPDRIVHSAAAGTRLAHLFKIGPTGLIYLQIAAACSRACYGCSTRAHTY